jgi:hypothetical protein
VSGSEEDNEAARADQLRRAVASVTGFELQRHDDGTFQIVWMSELTGEALTYEDEMTIEDVERWVNENVPKEEHEQQ